AALAVPKTLHNGAPFPDRDVIVFITSGVILVTLIQGLVLPAVVHWARLPADTGVEEERALANRVAAEEALAALPEIASRLGTDDHVVERTRMEYLTRLRMLEDPNNVEDDHDVRHETHYAELRLEMLLVKRATVVRLRDERRIDDTVLRQIQSFLDVEEVRLRRREPVEEPAGGWPGVPAPARRGGGGREGRGWGAGGWR